MIAAATGLFILGAAPSARAQSDDARKAARAAFGRALAAENRDDWRSAIVEYQEAYRLAPHPDVLYNIGAVYERLGELRAAAEQYQQYLDTKDAAADRAKVEKKIAALMARPSKVKITTTPPGATITVDGVGKGDAPVELTLSAGRHEIVAEAGEARASRAIELGYGEPLAVPLRVVAGRGTLVVTSNAPGAKVTVDGALVGVAPWNGALPAGRHVVVVSATGYTTVERTVDVPADGTAQITGALGRPIGYVDPEPRGTALVIGGDLGVLGDIGLVSTLYYGYRSERRYLEGGLGVVLGETGLGFAVVGRVYALTGRIRPYLGVHAGGGGSTQILHATGGLMLADLALGKAGIDLFVEAGYGLAHRTTGDDSLRFVPILAGLSLHVARVAPR